MPQRQVCSQCGATSFGGSGMCVMCKAPLDAQASQPVVAASEQQTVVVLPAAQAAAPTAPPPPSCRACRAAIAPGDRFCRNCGNRLSGKGRVEGKFCAQCGSLLSEAGHQTVPAPVAPVPHTQQPPAPQPRPRPRNRAPWLACFGFVVAGTGTALDWLASLSPDMARWQVGNHWEFTYFMRDDVPNDAVAVLALAAAGAMLASGSRAGRGILRRVLVALLGLLIASVAGLELLLLTQHDRTVADVGMGWWMTAAGGVLAVVGALVPRR